METRPDPVALLLVHGVGRQTRGDSLSGLIQALRRVYGDRLAVRRIDEVCARLEGLGRPIVAIEVHWADLLQGELIKGSFDFKRVFRTIWFPLLNLRSGAWRGRGFSRALVWGWMALLGPLSVFLSLCVMGAQFLSIIVTGMSAKRRQREDQLDEEARRRKLTFLQRARLFADDPDMRRTMFDDLMDDFAGDVLNYVDGTVHAFADGDTSKAICANVAQIQDRFVSAVQRAVCDEGCREIQVLAHSLGTVIAFRAMNRAATNEDLSGAPVRITRFYTIGSPLEKFRFFWPMLVAPAVPPLSICAGDQIVATTEQTPGGVSFEWHNFSSWADVVSGKLRKFEGWPVPTNHGAQGGGGLITSHVMYNSDPSFVTLLGRELTTVSVPADIRWTTRLWRRIRSTLEDVALPAGLVASALVGITAMAAMCYGLGWLCAMPVEWLGFASAARVVRWLFVGSMLFTMIALPVPLSKSDAKEHYEKFLKWSPESAKEARDVAGT